MDLIRNAIKLKEKSTTERFDDSKKILKYNPFIMYYKKRSTTMNNRKE